MSRLFCRTGLHVRGVHHRFGPIVAAEDVRLDVFPGQVHCLLGPSGSGKSTLLRLIAGLEKLQRGLISIVGEVVASDQVYRPPEHRAVGFVFQDYALFPHLDARQNVAFGMTDGSRREKLERAEAWLAKVSLESHARAMPHTLSGGQQQRVALARALARKPTVMLLDEPFSGLDHRLRGDIRRMTLELLRESEVATLMITHDPKEALLCGDLVSIIREGRILQTGTARQVYGRSASLDVAEIFGPVNHWRSSARAGRALSPWGDLEALAEDGSDLEGDVEILIRPDSLILSPVSDTTPESQSAEILGVERAGALATLLLQLGERSLQAQDFSRRHWRAGEKVQVDLEPGAAQILAVKSAI